MFDSTIAAISTGLTPSGIGIIRISGKDSFEIAKKIFKKNNKEEYSSFESHRVYHGFIFDKESIIDEILLLAMKEPKSYTGEDTIELQCHGGIFTLNKILDLVIKNGADIAEPGEFTKRAFLNGRLDLSKAEAVMDVISSKNIYALKNSVKQLNGQLFEKIIILRKEILNNTAFIEAALDDPEHYDLEGFSLKLRSLVCEWKDSLYSLSKSYDDGRILSEGIKTVILGKPNVGKSSFLNLICGSERAIVTDIAGTTRDVLTESVNINGINLNIYDTAGIHEAKDKVEEIGINKALSEADDADLIILIIDGSSLLSKEDFELFKYINKLQKNTLIILNKNDLNTKISEADIKKYLSATVIEFSANTGYGLSDFKKYVQDNFVAGILKFNDEIFISNLRQKEALDNAAGSLDQVISSIDNDLPEDFYTIDLKDAYSYLGFIIGEETSDDVIKEVFDKFCMGK